MAVAELTGIHLVRCFFASFGLIYLGAALDRPRALFLTLRNVRWGVSIHRDVVVRRIFLIVGFIFLVLAIALPIELMS